MLREEKKLEPIWKDNKCYCPVCGSTRILRREQCCLYKVYNENTGKQLNPKTLKRQMSNREIGKRQGNMILRQPMEWDVGLMSAASADGQVRYLESEDDN